MGASNEKRTTNATTTATTPVIDITKKAGPSALSANERSKSHAEHCAFTERNPVNSWPCPQRGQRPPMAVRAGSATWLSRAMDR